MRFLDSTCLFCEIRSAVRHPVLIMIYMAVCRKPQLCNPVRSDDLSITEVKACQKAADKASYFSVKHEADPLLRMYLTVVCTVNLSAGLSV